MDDDQADSPERQDAGDQPAAEAAETKRDAGQASPQDPQPPDPQPPGPQPPRQPVIEQVTSTAEDLARRAAPTVRDIGARVASVTADVAEASGPWLKRTAAATADLSLRLAERARAFAAELERDASGAGEPGPAEQGQATGASSTAGQEVEEVETASSIDSPPPDTSGDQPPADTATTGEGPER